MLGIGLIMFGAVIAISQIFVEVGGPLAPKLLSDMPTFFDYNTETGEQIQAINGEQNERLELYWLLVGVATIILTILGMIAGIGWFVEDFNLIQPGTAFKIITKVFIFLPFFMIFPYFWDLYAVGIENASLFLMDPFDDSSPLDRTQALWCAMGCIVPPQMFDIGAWGAALADPGTFGQGLLKDVFLALFKGIAVMMMTVMMFVLSAIRLVLTSVLIISLPLILVLSLIPIFKKATTLLTDNLIGLSIAPIFSAIVLTAGIAYLDSTQLTAMQDWFSTLAVGFLAVFFPILLSPMLGQMATQVGQAMQTAMQSTAMIGGSAMAGITSGVASASSAMEGAGANAAGSAVGAGIGSAAGNTVSSLNLGKASSGMSGFEKFKTLAKAGIMGMGAGAASGAMSSAGQMSGNPQMSRDAARSVMNAGQAKAFETGQMGVANHAVNGIGNNMASMETAQINPETHSAAFGNSGMSAPMVTNPGPMIGNMENSILDQPMAQQELLGMQQQNIHGFDQMNPNVQQQTSAKMMNNIQQHPNASGQMLHDMKLGGDGNQNSFVKNGI